MQLLKNNFYTLLKITKTDFFLEKYQLILYNVLIVNISPLKVELGLEKEISRGENVWSCVYSTYDYTCNTQF